MSLFAMSEISLSHQKKVLLYEYYATLQDANEIADPFSHLSLVARKPLDPKLTKIILAILAVAVVHFGIWYVARYFPVAKLDTVPPKPVVIEIIKPIEPPKPIKPIIPSITQKPIVPALVKTSEPVQKQAEAPTPKPIQRTPVEKNPQPALKEAVIPQQTAAEPVVKAEAKPDVKPEPVIRATEANEPVTEAKGYAGYLSNPAPEYPEQALERGWEGAVILRVKVSPNGRPAVVDVKQSSGKKVLDSAAVRTVKQWTFSPAKKGNNPVEGWVDVPIHYQLPK